MEHLSLTSIHRVKEEWVVVRRKKCDRTLFLAWRLSRGGLYWVQLYSSCNEGGGVGGGERDTVGLVAGPPPLLVFLQVVTLHSLNFTRLG